MELFETETKILALLIEESGVRVGQGHRNVVEKWPGQRIYQNSKVIIAWYSY